MGSFVKSQLFTWHVTSPLPFNVWRVLDDKVKFLNSSYFFTYIRGFYTGITPSELVFSVRGLCAQSHRVRTVYTCFCTVIKTTITYPKSSLSSFLDASKGTFRTRILELFCFFVEADLRCTTLSLKKKILKEWEM